MLHFHNVLCFCIFKSSVAPIFKELNGLNCTVTANRSLLTNRELLLCYDAPPPKLTFSEILLPHKIL
jgi:hypothetical protein